MPSTNAINDWVITCAKNINADDNVLINNSSCGLIIDPDYNNINKIPNTLTININKSNDLSQNSEWGMSYVIIWDSHLTDNEINLISNALNNYLNTNQPLNFNFSDTSTNSTQSSFYNNYPGLYLTELQKKMLLY